MTNEELNENGVEPPRRVPVLPSLITLGNILCGFSSICLAARGVDLGSRTTALSYAAWAILLAMVFDALDGRVARLTRQTSDFGGHLDSLSDVISFGVAPAFLVWQVIKESGTFPGWIERVMWLICVLYVVCAALRLARFDASNRHEEEAHRSFVGLPSPPAAGTVASLVLVYGWLDETPQLMGIVGSYVLPIVVFFVGLLMISKVRYPHMMNELFKNRRSFRFFMFLIFVLFLVGASKFVLLPVIFVVYVLSGLVGLAVDKILDRIDVAQSRRAALK